MMTPHAKTVHIDLNDSNGPFDTPTNKSLFVESELLKNSSPGPGRRHTMDLAKTTKAEATRKQLRMEGDWDSDASYEKNRSSPILSSPHLSTFTR